MKKYSTIIICFTLSVFAFRVFSQDSIHIRTVASHKNKYFKMTVRNAPSFTLQFSGAYSYGVFELAANDNGDFSSSEFVNGDNFGVRHGIGGSLVTKIPLHEEGNIRLNISGSFNTFSSKFSKVNVSRISIPEFVKYNVFTVGLGIENNFTPKYNFKTLIGFSFIGSLISGNARVNLDAANPTNISSLNIKPAFRLGVEIFSGFEYLISNNLGLNFGFQFTHANLWLKHSQTSNSPQDIYLNDKRVNTTMPFAGWKQFAFGSFFGGVNIYFGINEKEYVFRKD